MEKKRPIGKWQKLLYIGFFAVLLLSITLWDILAQDRFFSASENRILTAKPEADFVSVLDGSWEIAYETYLTDQFVKRDWWIGVKTFSEKQMGKKDINGVYLAKDGYLIERHTQTDKKEEAARQKLRRLRQDMNNWQELVKGRGGRVQALLVPAADMILADKLPAFAEDFNQFAFLEEMEEGRILVEQELLKHREEEIYYRTDHHWTTLGAYYGYTAWAGDRGVEAQPLSAFDRVVISDTFLGTLHSKLNLNVEPDRIEVFLPKQEGKYRVWYDQEETPETSLYKKTYLQTKNQYGVFLDDNHALVRIENTGRAKGSILVVKDSYANCFIPFLSAHYKQVYLIDKRYYRGKIDTFITENNVQDVLVLYNVIQFIENY